MMNAMRFPISLLSCVVLISLPAASARAGLFDFFNPAPPEPQYVTIERPDPAVAPPLITPLPPHRVEIHRRISIVHRNPSDKGPVLTGKFADLQKDGTLREGDAVMTQGGIRIFAGDPQGPHRPSEFAKLDDAKGLTSTEQVALAAIDAHPNETISGDAVVTGRSSAANSSLAWKWLRDPKGRLVRYVGP
jgi:hypothetical protein